MAVSKRLEIHEQSRAERPDPDGGDAHGEDAHDGRDAEADERMPHRLSEPCGSAFDQQGRGDRFAWAAICAVKVSAGRRKRSSSPVAVGDLDHTRALRQLIDQLLGGSAILLVEIGVPFVEQVDRGIGILDDFLERAQLPLAG
jgi:hypothetical protein